MENIEKTKTILTLLTSSGTSIEVSNNIREAISLAHQIVSNTNKADKLASHYDVGKFILHSTKKETLYFVKNEIRKYKGGGELSIYVGFSKKDGTAQVGGGFIVAVDGVTLLEISSLYRDIGTIGEIEINSLRLGLEIASSQLQFFDKIVIYSSASYGVNAISNWAYGWKNNGWRKPNGAIKNLKLIQESHELYNKIEERGKVSFYLLDEKSKNKDLPENMKILQTIKQSTNLSIETISNKIYGSKCYIVNNNTEKEKYDL